MIKIPSVTPDRGTYTRSLTENDNNLLQQTYTVNIGSPNYHDNSSSYRNT